MRNNTSQCGIFTLFYIISCIFSYIYPQILTKMLRQLKFTEEEQIRFKEEICILIKEGKPLSKLCTEQKKLQGRFPSKELVYRWLNDDSKFVQQYLEARKVSADRTAELIEETAADLLDKNLPKEQRLDPNAARVAIDALKWAAAVKNPSKYGKTLDITSGGEKVTPSAISVNIVKPKEIDGNVIQVEPLPQKTPIPLEKKK